MNLVQKRNANTPTLADKTSGTLTATERADDAPPDPLEEGRGETVPMVV